MSEFATTVGNPEWPLDPYGFTNPLRSAIVTAVARVRGTDEKAAILFATLEEAKKYLEARLVAQTEIREKQLAEAGYVPAPSEAPVEAA